MFIIIFFSLFVLILYLNNTASKQVDPFEDYASKLLTLQELIIERSSGYEAPKKTSRLELYFNEIERIDALSNDKEKELANDIQNGDQKSLEILVRSHLKNVIQIAQEISSHLHPELIHEGNLGLIEAGKEYDGKSIFRKFAKPYVIKYIQKELAEHPDNYKDPYVEPSKIRVRVCGTCLVNRKHQTT